jgi:hypothetical protein
MTKLRGIVYRDRGATVPLNGVLAITSIFVILCWFGIKSAKLATNWPDIPKEASKWN